MSDQGRAGSSHAVSQVAEPNTREVRACFSDSTVRVYQAFSHEIADRAVMAQTFKAPFKRNRMTWLKPSFAWMMYRSGWGTKPGQECVLGVDILRTGFEWALAHSCLSAFDAGLHGDHESWVAALRSSPVRIQWDPERTLDLEPLPWRTVQIGLGGHAVDAYLDEWITKVEDMTALVREVQRAAKNGDTVGARRLLPMEVPYPIPIDVSRQIGCGGRR